LEGAANLVDLSGRSVRTIDATTGRELALDWGEEKPPASEE
jgi:hypothetical protein